MSVWKSIFLHEFPDGDLTNLHAVPGEVAVSPGGPLVGPPPEPGERGFSVHPGRTISYALADPLAEVIGVDVSLDVDLRPQPGQAFPLLSIDGGAVELSLSRLRFAFIGPELRGFTRLAFAVGDERIEVDLEFSDLETLRLRARWHTHGQGQIWQQGTLRAYEPGFAAGRRLALGRLVGGGPEGVIVDPGGLFRARRVYWKALREDDARATIDDHLPLDERYLKPTPCAERVRALFVEATSRSREFMTGVVSALTTSWRDGQPGGQIGRAHV